MTTRWITNNRDRRSKKYLALHAALKADVARDKLPEPNKQSRKRERSQDFRARGE